MDFDRRKYYIVLEYQRKGPFNIKELKERNITKDTLIWAFEFNEPQKASEIPELSVLFDNSQITSKQSEKQEDTPPINQQSTDNLSLEEAEKILEKAKKEEKNFSPTSEKIEEKQSEESENIKNNTQETQKRDLITPPPPPSNQDEQKEQFIPPPIETEQQTKYITDSKTYDNKPIFSETKPQKPKNYLGWALFLTFACCNPVGFAAIITASSVEKKYQAKDFAGAERMSKTTKSLIIIAVVFTILSFLFLLATD